MIIIGRALFQQLFINVILIRAIQAVAAAAAATAMTARASNTRSRSRHATTVAVDAPQ